MDTCQLQDPNYRIYYLVVAVEVAAATAVVVVADVVGSPRVGLDAAVLVGMTRDGALAVPTQSTHIRMPCTCTLLTLPVKCTIPYCTYVTELTA